MKKIFDYLVNLIFPNRCSICQDIILDKYTYNICPNCIENVTFIDGKCCVKCGKKIISKHNDICYDCKSLNHKFDRAYSIVQYNGAIKKLLKGYKFYNKREVLHTIVDLMEYKINKIPKVDFVIGVPSHKSRLKERGFNQSEEIAKLLAKRSGLIFNNNIIIKTRDTKKQSTLPKNMRLENLKNSFKVVNNIKMIDKVILLIDDIYTTGTTVSECAKELKDAGAKKVYVLTVASGEGY